MMRLIGSPACRWSAWAVYALAWSLALLLPVPEAGEELVGWENTFVFSKFVHVGGFTALTLLGLALPGRWRWAGLAYASLFAVLSEFLQWLLYEWMHRHGRWADVGLDHIGIGIGLLAALAIRYTSLRTKPSMPTMAAAQPVSTVTPANRASSYES